MAILKKLGHEILKKLGHEILKHSSLKISRKSWFGFDFWKGQNFDFQNMANL